MRGSSGDGSRRLGGGGWPDRFFAGGGVDGAGIEIARVELRFDEDGVTLRDEVQEGIVLFITDETVSTPGIAVLLDGSGGQVGCHPAFPEL